MQKQIHMKSCGKKLCEEYMGKHPVISISLKGINAASYEAAFELTVKTIKGAVQKAGFLKMSDKLDEDEKKEYRAILDENMSEATLFWSLKNLSELLEKHYETKVILLIDEYDVPLAKAFENGYYDKMVFLIRNLLEQTLKTNNSLKFAGIGSDMVLPWRKGLEKEIPFEPKYLPLLWVDAKGTEAQIRYQYMDLITKLYRDNFTKVLSDWCHAHGVLYLGHTIEDNGAHARLGYGTGHYFRGQETMDYAGIDVIGGQVVPGMNYHHDAFNTGGSNGEFYHYALAKLASSAAHLDPLKKGNSMCEAFGAYGWNEGLKMMKWITDHLIVRGINHLVPHAFDPKEFPDFDCPPHFYAHGMNPQFRYFPVFTAYANRLMEIFRNGKHPAKVGLLYPAEMEWGGEYMPVEKPARVLTENQISFDIISLDYLEKAEIAEQCYFINGQRFEVMVVPYGTFMPLPGRELLGKLQEAGVTVIYLPKDIQSCQLAEKLHSYRAVILEKEEPELAVGEYEKDNKRYLMLFNENIGNAVDTVLQIQGGKFIYRYDVFEDRMTRVSPCMKLHLEPYESILLIQSEEDLALQPQDISLEQAQTDCSQMLPKTWKVMFADSTSYPDFQIMFPTEKLELVSSLPGFEEITGTVRYEGMLWKNREASSLILDLGNAYETAEVFINNISVGVRICKPYRFDLTSFLQEGQNQIVVEVTNTLGTQMRDPISHYLPIEPFGVEGPVRMYKEEK